jgi:hypothetical protein
MLHFELIKIAYLNTIYLQLLKLTPVLFQILNHVK